MSGRRWIFWSAVALTALFALRAAIGVVAGLSFSAGRRLAREGRYEEAIRHLDRAAAGERSAEARWLAGQARVGLWEQRLLAGAQLEEVEPLLDEAHRDATAALAASPASGWYWVALADVYHRSERLAVHRTGLPLARLGEHRWAGVGHEGRVAIGLLRIGIEREPNWYPFHDQLAYVLYDYFLEDEAMDAVERSARVQPIYELHPYRTLEPPDPRVLDAFARGAYEGLGETPWLDPVLHRLALGRIEVRRERWTAAETHLREALEAAVVPLNVAEGHYWLGLALEGQGRFDEAAEAFVAAEAGEPFVAMATIARARLYERIDDEEAALDLWLRARRVAPERLDAAIGLARVARGLRRFDLAAHAVREAMRRHPESPEPRIEAVRLALAEGEAAKASMALDELRGISPDHPAIAVFERVLTGDSPR